jgi:hypothetical protein
MSPSSPPMLSRMEQSADSSTWGGRRSGKAARQLERASTLTHPGSLYVGSGLGMRKASKVSDAMSGSTKHMIKTILAKRKEEEERALFADADNS